MPWQYKTPSHHHHWWSLFWWQSLWRESQSTLCIDATFLYFFIFILFLYYIYIIRSLWRESQSTFCIDAITTCDKSRGLQSGRRWLVYIVYTILYIVYTSIYKSGKRWMVYKRPTLQFVFGSELYTIQSSQCCSVRLWKNVHSARLYGLTEQKPKI